MIVKLPLRILALAGLTAAAFSPARALDELPGVFEPQALRLQIKSAYTGVRLEAERDKTDYNSGGSATYEREFLAPVLGLDAAGSVYHPNLLSFSLSGEILPGYAWEKSSFGTAPINKKEIQFLGDYNANFTFLSNKPYHFTLFASQSYTYRDFDFFDRVEVDTLRYGGNFGYQDGPVPFTLNVWRRSEDYMGQTNTASSSFDETVVEFAARNTRKSGETALNYNLTDFARRSVVDSPSDRTQTLGLSDSESFGDRNQIRLMSTAGYTDRTAADNPGHDLNALANLTIEHSSTVSSDYDASYYRTTSTSSAGSVTSNSFSGGAGIHHQLYESLSSSLRLQGQAYDAKGSFEDSGREAQSTSNSNTRYGINWSEQYTKRLGEIGRFSLFGSLLVEHVNIDNTGTMIVVNDERHLFGSDTSGSDSFFLSLPDVDQSSIVVRDAANTSLVYQEGRDYTLSTNSVLTMIRRVAIPVNSPVLVDYRAQQSVPSGSYNTTTGILNGRVDLWNGLVSVYGRYTSLENSSLRASSEEHFLLESLAVYSVGLESTWRWLRAGIEYENHDSSFSSYHNTRLFQSFSFKPDPISALNFDFTEAQTDYLDAGRTEKNFAVFTRYQRGMGGGLSMHLDAGVSVRRGEGVDQSLAAIRPGFEWSIGRLELKAGYNFEYGQYQNSDKRQKQYLFISGRRNF